MNDKKKKALTALRNVLKKHGVYIKFTESTYSGDRLILKWVEGDETLLDTQILWIMGADYLTEILKGDQNDTQIEK